MRLFELTQPARQVYATDRFRKEYVSEVKSNGDFQKLVADFISFKETSALDAQYGRKDAPFRFGDRKGYWHCHLIYGKRVVTYSITPTSVFLITLTDHAAYEGRRSAAFDAYLKSVQQADYSTFSAEPKAPSPAPADDGLKQRIVDLAYDLTGPDERHIIEALAAGQPNQFFAWAEMVESTPREMYAAFGSNRQHMMDFAAEVLRNTEIK